MEESHKVVIKNTDMSEEMQATVFKIATEAPEQYNFEKDIAAYVKREFEKETGASWNSPWNCIAGKDFGASVAHEKGKFIYFYIGYMAFMLFKTG